MDTNEHELFGASVASGRPILLYPPPCGARGRVSQRHGYNIMGRPGLEPGTNALKGRCSTD